MTALWASRNPRERFMLLLCLAAVAIGVPMALTSPTSSGKALLPAAQARQKYDGIRSEKRALDQDSDRLKPQIAGMVYTAAAEDLMPQVIKILQTDAKESGIHLREVKPLRGRRMGSVTKVPLTVRFTSEFGKCVPFIYRGRPGSSSEPGPSPSPGCWRRCLRHGG